MNISIQKLYETPLRHQSLKAVSWHYKINKGIANLLYPLFGKCNYGINEDSNVIISLTSYPARISTLHLTIKSLLNQGIKPKMVILWLAKEQFPNMEKDLPEKLLGLRKMGLTINFCDDLKPHKKYYYTMKENPESYVITVDDDVLYPENLVEILMDTSDKYPDTVVCTWGHVIEDIENTATWNPTMDGTIPSFSIVPTGVGGVLYPPHCLSEEVYNKESIKKLCLNADDLWLKAMALKNRKKAVRVNMPAKLYFSILKTQKSGLYYENALEDKNTEAWKKILETYPECKSIIH